MSDFLKGLGIAAWLVGGWLLVTGFQLDVTVNPDGQGYVANLQLMHIQQLDLLLGALAALAGTVAFTGGCIMDQIKAQTDRLMRGEAHRPSANGPDPS